MSFGETNSHGKGDLASFPKRISIFSNSQNRLTFCPKTQAPKILITIKRQATIVRMKSWVVNLQFLFGYKQLSCYFFKSILIE